MERSLTCGDRANAFATEIARRPELRTDRHADVAQGHDGVLEPTKQGQALAQLQRNNQTHLRDALHLIGLLRFRMTVLADDGIVVENLDRFGGRSTARKVGRMRQLVLVALLRLGRVRLGLAVRRLDDGSLRRSLRSGSRGAREGAMGVRHVDVLRFLLPVLPLAVRHGRRSSAIGLLLFRDDDILVLVVSFRDLLFPLARLLDAFFDPSPQLVLVNEERLLLKTLPVSSDLAPRKAEGCSHRPR